VPRPSRPLARLAGLITVALPLALAPGAAASPASPRLHDQLCGPRTARTVAIVLHSGGFAWGLPWMTARVCRRLGAAGLRVRNVDYALRDVGGAVWSLRLAILHERHRCRRCSIVAYGESAGGSLAALAAARGWVDRAVAWAPISDLGAWARFGREPGEPGRFDAFAGSGPGVLHDASPLTWAGPASAPLIVLHGPEDTVVPFAQSEALLARWPGMRVVALDDPGHLEARNRARVLRSAVRFLARPG
jgi:acetyl esterase/lipase